MINASPCVVFICCFWHVGSSKVRCGWKGCELVYVMTLSLNKSDIFRLVSKYVFFVDVVEKRKQPRANNGITCGTRHEGPISWSAFSYHFRRNRNSESERLNSFHQHLFHGTNILI